MSGLFGTERITLNDNLLNRASLPEIEAVMGHEMGHYVLNHIQKALMELAIIFYDHPSGRTRILTTMRWKAEHPETWTASGATR